MSKTIAMTIEVVTRTTHTVQVQVPDEIGPSRYAEIGMAIYSSVPEAVFTTTDRSFERLTFENSRSQGDLSVRLQSDGNIELAPCTDLMKLTLIDGGDLHHDRKVILNFGTDSLGREIITTPAFGPEIECLTVNVAPFTDEAIELAKDVISSSLLNGAPVNSINAEFVPYSEAELKSIRNQWSLDVSAVVTRPRHAFTLSSFGDFESFVFEMYAEDESALGAADLVRAFSLYQKERSCQFKA